MTVSARDRYYAYYVNDGAGKNKKMLKGKDMYLCKMSEIDIFIPPGFVTSTEACFSYTDMKIKNHTFSAKRELK